MILTLLGIALGTFVGAFTGLGGGIIVKLVLDFTNLYNPATVSVFSSLIVLAMTTSSIIRQWFKKFKFDLDIAIYVSLGSILGGYLSEVIFNWILNSFETKQIKSAQSIGVLIIFTLIYLYNKNKEKFPKYRIKNRIFMFVIGLLLGVISIILGIGGGPINMVVFVFLFSFSIKEAIFYTLITIFFSQLTRVGTLLVNGNLFKFDLKTGIILAVMGVVGGLIGTYLNQKSSEETVQKAHNFMLLVMIGLTLYNIVS